MITLFTNHWSHRNRQRQIEIDCCINKNIQQCFIDRVVIIGQSRVADRMNIAPETSNEEAQYISKFGVDVRRLKKVIWENIDCKNNLYNRPTFGQYFELVNKYCRSPYDINIIANSDIYFDDTIGQLRSLNLNNICIALTRHEVHKNTPSAMEWGAGTQDVWIVQGKVRPVSSADWPMGVWGCDSRICWELENAGYSLINPCKTIMAWHLHGDPNMANRGETLVGPMRTVAHSSIEECRIPAKSDIDCGIIAYSLFGGNNPKYCQGAIQNAKLAKVIYPGWVVRIYHDNSIPQTILDALRKLNVDLVLQPQLPNQSGTFWRLFAADDPGYTRWMVRDLDSRLNYRERAAVDDWIKSGLPYHAMRDHPSHNNPIICCAFGGLTCQFSMADAVSKWNMSGLYCDDEKFLFERIWPIIKDKILIHDGCSLERRHGGGIMRPFPVPREFGRFVGEIFDADERCNSENRNSILRSHETKLV